jgi:hypothetical protein
MTALVEVRERPISFKPDMIRAILEGRKTMTRRVMRVQPDLEFKDYPIVPWVIDGEQQFTSSGGTYFIADYRQGMTQSFACPYGKVGDHLWVKETWQKHAGYFYLADRLEEYQAAKAANKLPVVKWRPSIFMPRVASRITLQITDIRVERLQQISEEDAKAEGVLHNWIGQDCPLEYQGEYMNYEGDEEDFPCYSAHDSYRTLWDKINAKRPGCDWDSNPWVWCYTFRRIER